MKNIGDVKLPAVLVGKRYGFYELSSMGGMSPARTRHGLVRDLTSRAPEFAAGKGRQNRMRGELQTADTLPVWSITILFSPSEGSAGAFYKYSRATATQVIFKFWRVN